MHRFNDLMLDHFWGEIFGIFSISGIHIVTPIIWKNIGVLHTSLEIKLTNLSCKNITVIWQRFNQSYSVYDIFDQYHWRKARSVVYFDCQQYHPIKISLFRSSWPMVRRNKTSDHSPWSLDIELREKLKRFNGGKNVICSKHSPS